MRRKRTKSNYVVSNFLNVDPTVEGAFGVYLRYVLMAKEDQLPWAFKFCSGTSLSAAHEMADLLNAWKP